MIALIGTVFVASLLGSMHCVGMCGAFVAFACNPTDAAGPRLAPIVAYNLGRLATYTLLGLVAGLIGHAVDLGASAFGLQQAAAIVAASMLVAFGLGAFLRTRGVRLPRAPIPGFLRSIVIAGQKAAMAMTPTRRALTVGLLTTLLPCGWLYAFAIAAAGTGSPWLGALTMAVFWAGTLPALIALGASVQRFAGPLASRMPVLTSLAIVVVGLLTIGTRLPLLLGGEAMAGEPTPSGVAGAIEHVRTVDHADLPCCEDH